MAGFCIASFLKLQSGNKIQYNTMQYNTIQYNTIQFSFKVKSVERKTPLITVAGIALKGQADLISIMVPLEVLV